MKPGMNMPSRILPTSACAVGPMTTASTDGGMMVPSAPPAQMTPRDQALVVAVAQHGRDRQQPDHGLGGADHPARRREDHAHDDGADGQAAGQAPDPHLDGIEQAVGDAGLLEHGAHEDEQRHGGEHLRGRRLLDLLDALMQQAFEAERMQAEDHRQRQHGERDRKPGQDRERGAPGTSRAVTSRGPFGLRGIGAIGWPSGGTS